MFSAYSFISLALIHHVKLVVMRPFVHDWGLQQRKKESERLRLYLTYHRMTCASVEALCPEQVLDSVTSYLRRGPSDHLLIKRGKYILVTSITRLMVVCY